MKRLSTLVLSMFAASCGSGAGGASSATLPVAVDNLFAASGYEGDGANPGAIVDAQACPVRAGNREGKCHKFTWTPNTAGAVGWAGVLWQFPANNWGTLAGQPMPAGAKSVKFYAWGATGSEKVSFYAGLPNSADGFTVTTNVIDLTTTPTLYTLNISKVTYDKVISGFGWSAGAQGSGPVVFYIDDVEWTADAPVTAVPGCLDTAATNYNAGATADDASCTYNVALQVDMTGTNTPPTAKVQVRGDYNGYCADCNVLALQSGNVWGTTPAEVALKPGTYRYKFATDATQAGFEIVPKACSADPTLSDADRTRKVVVTAAAQTVPVVKFGACP